MNVRPRGKIKKGNISKMGSRQLKETRYGVDERLYHRAGVDKIAYELEKAGARIEQQDEGLYMVYPTRNVRLCHGYGSVISLRNAWDGSATQGKRDTSKVEFYCHTCHKTKDVWQSVDTVLRWGK